MDKPPFFLHTRVFFQRENENTTQFHASRANMQFEIGSWSISILLGTDVHPNQVHQGFQPDPGLPPMGDCVITPWWVNSATYRHISDIEVLITHKEDEQFNDQWPKRLTDPVKLCILLGLVASEPNPSRLMEKIAYAQLFE
jgi:hypothetical protein